MRFNVAHWLKQPVGFARDFELQEDISRLSDDLHPLQALTGRIRLLRIPSGILVAGTCRTVLSVACRRCLEPVAHPVEFQLEEIFRSLTDIDSGRYVHPQEYEGPAETMFDEALLINDRHELDLEEVVRQHLWIAALQYPACVYADPEACPHFQQSQQDLARVNAGAGDDGADVPATAPVDPRWAALLLLRTDQSAQTGGRPTGCQPAE